MSDTITVTTANGSSSRSFWATSSSGRSSIGRTPQPKSRFQGSVAKRTKYQKVLDGYLKWIGSCGIFLRSKSLPLNPDAPDAFTCMKRWESEGVIPTETSEPELLADYVQGKTLRDWHISEWKDGIRQNLFQAEEFLGTLGVTYDNFASIFGHPPRGWTETDIT